MSCVESHLLDKLYELEEDMRELENLRRDLEVAKLFRRLHITNIEGDYKKKVKVKTK